MSNAGRDTFTHNIGTGPGQVEKASQTLRENWAVVPGDQPGADPVAIRSGLNLGGVRLRADVKALGRNDAVADAFPMRTDKDGLYVLLSDASTAVNIQTIAPISVPSSWFPERLPAGCPAVIVRGYRTGNPDNNVAIRDRPLTADLVRYGDEKRTSSVIWGTNRRGNYSPEKGAGVHWAFGVILSPNLEPTGLGGAFHDASGSLTSRQGEPGWVSALNFILPQKAKKGAEIGSAGNLFNVQAGQGRFFQVNRAQTGGIGTSLNQPVYTLLIPPSVTTISGTASTVLGTTIPNKIPVPVAGGSLIEVGSMAGGYDSPLSQNDGPIMADSVWCSKHFKAAKLGPDGNAYCESCGHISTEAFFKVPNNIGLDGPLEFVRDVYIPEFSGPYPFLTQLRMDNRYAHNWNGQTLPGVWRWETWGMWSGTDDGTAPPTEYPPPYGPPPPPAPPPGPPGGGIEPGDGTVDPTRPKPPSDGAHDAMTPHIPASPGYSYIGRPVSDSGEVGTWAPPADVANPRARMTRERLQAFHKWPAVLRMTAFAQMLAGAPKVAERPDWMRGDLRPPASGGVYLSPPEVQIDSLQRDTAGQTGSPQVFGLHPDVVVHWGYPMPSSTDPATMIRKGWRLSFDEATGRFNIDYIDAAGAVDATKDVYVNGSAIGGGGGGGGDVSGPGSSTDKAIPRWNGTAGTDLLDSGVIIDNSNNVTGMASLTLTYDGLYIRDSDLSHTLQVRFPDNLSANRVFNVDVNDADRTISLSGDLTVAATASVSGTNTGDQTLSGLGGIGGSTGSTDNRLLRADGTGAATLQASPVTMDDSGNVTDVGSITPVADATQAIGTAAKAFGAGFIDIVHNADPGAWSNGSVKYYALNLVYVAATNKTIHYRCIKEHTSADSNGPMLGTTRDTYWEMILPQNMIQPVELVGGGNLTLAATDYPNGSQIVVTMDETGSCTVTLPSTAGTDGQYGDKYWITLAAGSSGGTYNLNIGSGLAVLDADGESVQIKWAETGWYIESSHGLPAL